MYRFLMSRRYVKLLFAIDSPKSKNIRHLAKESGMTNSHLCIVMDQLFREGIVDKIKQGREYDIEFTEAGKELLKIIREYDKLAKKQIKNNVKGQEEKPKENKQGG